MKKFTSSNIFILFFEVLVGKAQQIVTRRSYNYCRPNGLSVAKEDRNAMQVQKH